MIGMCVSKLSDGAYTASEAAQAAYATLDGRPDGQRTLFLRHCGEKRTGVANLKPDTYYDFMVNGARADEWRAFMSDYWVAWAQSGDMRPSRIVLEFEQHYEWYAITGTNADRAALVQSVRDAGTSGVIRRRSTPSPRPVPRPTQTPSRQQCPRFPCTILS